MRPSDDNKLSAALLRSETAEAAGEPMPQPIQSPLTESEPTPAPPVATKEERVLAPPLEFEKKLHRIRLSRLRADLDNIRACLISMANHRTKTMEQDAVVYENSRAALKTAYESEKNTSRLRYEFALDELDSRRSRLVDASAIRYEEDTSLFMGQARDIERTVQVVEIGISALDKA